MSSDKKDLEGRQVSLYYFPGRYFYLTYAGWGDQWIIRNNDNTDMMRVSGDEALPHLIEPYVEETVIPKFPNNIMEVLRESRSLEPWETKKDKQINELSKNEAFKKYLEWEGIIGYEHMIKQLIKDIYGVDLDQYN